MKTSLLSALLTAFTLISAADESFMQGKRFACGDYSGKKVCIVEADGTISWQHKAPSCDDLWLLPNNRILFTTKFGVKEMNYKTDEVLFEYTSKSEIYAVQRLPDNSTFVGECNSGRLLTLDKDGKVIKSVDLLPVGKDGGSYYSRNARVLKNGNYLVAHYGLGKLIEYSSKGKILWEVKTPGGPHSTCRLANGNTMVSCSDNGTPSLVEYNPTGAIVWMLSNKDLKGNPLKFITGFQKLPNENFIICNWVGHGKFGQAPHLLEVTPGGKIVWTFNDHKNFRALGSIQLFKEDDTPLCGEGTH